MSITSDLRGFALICDKQTKKTLLMAADRIDAEVADMQAFCDRLREAAESREDVTLFGVDYAALEAKRRKTHTTEYCDRCEGAVLPKWKNCPWCGEPLEEVEQ